MKVYEKDSIAEVNQAPSVTQISISRVLKIAVCSNLSCKSNLTYHIACNSEKEIYIRVTNNDGGGYFASEWISLKSILEAITGWQRPLTSRAIYHLFHGKSANSPGFLFAALYAEGLIERHIDNPRIFVACDHSAFVAEMDQLINSEVKSGDDKVITGGKTDSLAKKSKSSKTTRTTSTSTVN